MEPGLSLAVVQSPGNLSGPEARTEWLRRKLRDMAERGVDIILLPELFLTGYNVGEAVWGWAEAHDGYFAGRIAELARSYQVAIHYGFAERCKSKLYNSAQCFGPNGERLVQHRKLALPPGYEGDHFSAGAICALFELKQFRIATLICYDAEFPEAFRHVAMMGADLVLVPTALADKWSIVARHVIPTRAFENGVFVAYANHAGEEGNMRYLGESCVIGPNGKELARAGDGEQTLSAQLALREVVSARAQLPYLSACERLLFNCHCQGALCRR